MEQKPDRPVSIHSVFEDLMVQQKAMKPALTIELNDPDLSLQTDKDKLTAILGHLIQNAQEATNDDGSVRIIAANKGNRIQIEVIDNGAGMTQAFIRNRLFKPFDTTKGNAGMGIGVFEAQQFAETHKGTLSVTSTVDEGSHFTLSLPA